MSYVFEEIIVLSSPNHADVVATLDRPTGPIEEGRFDDVGNWQPSDEPTRVGAIGFGIDALGRPYFDALAPDEGEEAEMYVDAVNGQIWLER